MSDTYVILKNEDDTEQCCTTKENLEASPILKNDVDGRPMILVETFEAESWNAAMTHYHEVMGFEPYKPDDG
jgi:hypothetical protein